MCESAYNCVGLAWFGGCWGFVFRACWSLFYQSVGDINLAFRVVGLALEVWDVPAVVSCFWITLKLQISKAPLLVFQPPYRPPYF